MGGGWIRSVRFDRDDVEDRDRHPFDLPAPAAGATPTRPATGFFLRAESFFNVASVVDELGGAIAAAYGDRSLHEQSHGESFLALVLNRFGPNGLHVMAEPEAALSPQGRLALMRAIHDLVEAGSQFLVATHSPLLIACPDADVHELDDEGITRRDYRETKNFELFRTFTEAPERFLTTCSPTDDGAEVGPTAAPRT